MLNLVCYIPDETLTARYSSRLLDQIEEQLSRFEVNRRVHNLLSCPIPLTFNHLNNTHLIHLTNYASTKRAAKCSNVL